MSDAIGDDARAEQVPAQLGIPHGGSAVGAVPEGEADALRLQGADHAVKPPVLEEGIVPAVSVVFVGDGKVGEDSLRRQSRQGAGPPDGLPGGFEPALVAGEP